MGDCAWIRRGTAVYQYMVYLGELDAAPAIKPGDDVAIADWVKVSDIQRQNAKEYVVNGKPPTVYMLRGLEVGLKEVWHHLLQQSSTRISSSGKWITRFSSPENVAAEIEMYCDKHQINLEGDYILPFLKILAGDMPEKTYTGKEAQSLLNSLLKVANYLMSPGLKPERFINDMIGSCMRQPELLPRLYSGSVNLTQFKPRQEERSSWLQRR